MRWGRRELSARQMAEARAEADVETENARRDSFQAEAEAHLAVQQTLDAIEVAGQLVGLPIHDELIREHHANGAES